MVLECAFDGQKLQDEVLSESIRFSYRWRKKVTLMPTIVFVFVFALTLLILPS